MNDQLTLTTNDRRSTQFPVIVEGRIVPELAVSPASLLLGTLQPGQEIKKQIVVKGAEPFKIVDIRCQEQGFHFQPSDEVKVVHLVPGDVHRTQQAGQADLHDRDHHRQERPSNGDAAGDL